MGRRLEVSVRGGPTVQNRIWCGCADVKGGMKAKVAHKTGPRRVFEARHADGMPLQISFQVRGRSHGVG